MNVKATDQNKRKAPSLLAEYKAVRTKPALFAEKVVWTLVIYHVRIKLVLRQKSKVLS